MAKYRKKPVEIEAVQWTGSNIDEIIAFVGKSLDYKQTPWYTSMRIHTLEGAMECSKGDYIIKGVDGEFYPCKPNIFKKTYEPVLKVSFDADVLKGVIRRENL